MPGAQCHGDSEQLQCRTGPGLRVPARALPQPGGPLCDCRSLQVLVSPPSETPQRLCATYPPQPGPLLSLFWGLEQQVAPQHGDTLWAPRAQLP